MVERLRYREHASDRCRRRSRGRRPPVDRDPSRSATRPPRTRRRCAGRRAARPGRSARISPGAASASSRAASITATPWSSPSSNVTSPTLMPMRISNAAAASARRPYARTARWIEMAAATEAEAVGNDALTPSPVQRSTVPRFASTASRIISSCARRSASARSSPIRDRSAVDPTTSVNMMALVASSPWFTRDATKHVSMTRL